MIPVELFVPSLEDLAVLARIQPGPIYAGPEESSPFYVRNELGGWVSLSESVGEIFVVKTGETCLVPGISVQASLTFAPTGLFEVGCIPDFSYLSYLIRAHWVGPSSSSAHQTMTAYSDSIDSIPDSARAIGASLCGIIFYDLYQDPLLLIATGEAQSKQLRLTTNGNAIAKISDGCDLFFSAADAIGQVFSQHLH